jgi:hypothetical protein
MNQLSDIACVQLYNGIRHVVLYILCGGRQPHSSKIVVINGRVNLGVPGKPDLFRKYKSFLILKLKINTLKYTSCVRTLFTLY